MKELDQKFMSVVRLVQRLEKEPRRYGTDVKLTATEIHLIEIIGENEDMSVTDIAKLFGVTKGAVSQKLKQLEGKGVIRKMPDPANVSRHIVTLTSKGELAFEKHMEWHEAMDGGFKAYKKSLGEEKLEIIREFLIKIEDLFIRMLQVEK